MKGTLSMTHPHTLSMHCPQCIQYVYNAKKKYEGYLPPQGGRYAGEVQLIPSIVLFTIS